jgi:hypothetical protein
MSMEVWSYSGDPSSSLKDEVRFLIGDTDSNDKLLNDKEILYCISLTSTAYGAAVKACEALASKFAREADQVLGPTREFLSQKAKAYERKASYFRRRERGRWGPYSGGQSLLERARDEADPDLPQPTFKRNMFEGANRES